MNFNIMNIISISSQYHPNNAISISHSVSQFHVWCMCVLWVRKVSNESKEWPPFSSMFFSIIPYIFHSSRYEILTTYTVHCRDMFYSIYFAVLVLIYNNALESQRPSKVINIPPQLGLPLSISENISNNRRETLIGRFSRRPVWVIAAKIEILWISNCSQETTGTVVKRTSIKLQTYDTAINTLHGNFMDLPVFMWESLQSNSNTWADRIDEAGKTDHTLLSLEETKVAVW